MVVPEKQISTQVAGPTKVALADAKATSGLANDISRFRAISKITKPSNIPNNEVAAFCLAVTRNGKPVVQKRNDYSDHAEATNNAFDQFEVALQHLGTNDDNMEQEGAELRRYIRSLDEHYSGHNRLSSEECKVSLYSNLTGYVINDNMTVTRLENLRERSRREISSLFQAREELWEEMRSECVPLINELCWWREYIRQEYV